MVSALRNTVAGGGGLSAKSYPQDGAKFLFDGIENAVWGTHSGSPSTWADLVGGRHMTISSTAYLSGWRDYGFVFNNNAYFQNVGTSSDNLLQSLGSIWTIFCVTAVAPSILSTLLYSGAFGNTSEGSGHGLQCPQFNRASGGNYGAFGNYPHAGPPNGVELPFASVTTNEVTSFAFVGTPTKYALYINGALYRTVTPGSTQNTTMTKATCYLGATQTGRKYIGTIFGMRGYSRELSVDEIAASSNIDHQRFEPLYT